MSRISEQNIHKALSQIRHPVIDRNIMELGIVRTVKIENNVVVITMAFPFIGAPAKDISIRNQMITDVKKSVENFGLKFQLKQTEMTPEELNRFLGIEKETWKDIASD
jgi:metal-sulfur cluster biosynthetic enzyme